MVTAREQQLLEALREAGDVIQSYHATTGIDLGDASRMPFYRDTIARIDAVLVAPAAADTIDTALVQQALAYAAAAEIVDLEIGACRAYGQIQHIHILANVKARISALTTADADAVMKEKIDAAVKNAGMWRPISSNPKDGEDFIACLGTGEYAVMLWHDGEDDWTDSFGAIIGYPTHWKPLGEGPTTADGYGTK